MRRRVARHHDRDRTEKRRAVAVLGGRATPVAYATELEPEQDESVDPLGLELALQSRKRSLRIRARSGIGRGLADRPPMVVDFVPTVRASMAFHLFRSPKVLKMQ